MTPEELYEKAYDLHYKGNDPQQALTLYEQICADHPGSPQAGYSKSQITNIQSSSANSTPRPVVAKTTAASTPARNTTRCTRCGESARYTPEQSQFWCDKCQLYVIPPPSQPGTDVVMTGFAAEPKQAAKPAYTPVGQALVLIGGIALAVGPFLSWATVSGIVSMSASGMDKTDGEALIVVFAGAIAMLAALASISQRRDSLGGASAFGGLIGGVATLYYYTIINDQLSELDGGGLAMASIGGGIYLCFAGAAAVLVGLGVVSASGSSQ